MDGNCSLAEKVIVVIGGTTGLGLSAAKAFVASGAKVVVVGRDPDNVQKAETELQGHARGLAGDASVSETSVKAIELAVNAFGGFDGLYHVAGGSGRKMGDGPLHQLTDEGLQAVLDLNLVSLIYSNRAAVAQFLKQNSGGSILNMSSTLAYSPAPRFFATHAYAAVKSAAIGFTRSIASYYAPMNIRANVIAPALVETPMSKRASTDEAILKFIHTKQPLDGGRIGKAEDLDAATVYFMSDGSLFTTGQILAVDGGWSVSDGQISTV